MNSKDPRSLNYKRIYNKTPINIPKLLILVILYILGVVILNFMSLDKVYFLLFTTVYFILNIKNILILFIEIYQHIAPISIRSKCRFEPSCSNYMLMCLQKYGLIRGLKKGINRLKRCNITDGGYDYP